MISVCKSGWKYPKLFDKKVKLSEGTQKLDFATELSEKIKCRVEGLASWLAQPNFTKLQLEAFLSFVNFQKKNCFGAGNDLSSKVRFKQMILFFLVFFCSRSILL